MKKMLIIIIFTILILLLLYLLVPKKITKIYDNAIITIKTNEINKNKILKKINKILNENYSKELYNINHNFNKDEYLMISSNLSDIINDGLKIYDKSNHMIDISKGNLYDLWNAYTSTKVAYPTKEELILANKQSITDIILKNNMIKNNHVNINIDSIIKKYKIKKIENYLSKNKITNYTINMSDYISIKNNQEKIGLFYNNKLYKTLEIKNKYLVTTNYIIDLNTLYPANNFKQITVISDNIDIANLYSKILFQMDIEKGKELVKEEKINIIWYTNDNKVIEYK